MCPACWGQLLMFLMSFCWFSYPDYTLATLATLATTPFWELNFWQVSNISVLRLVHAGDSLDTQGEELHHFSLEYTTTTTLSEYLLWEAHFTLLDNCIMLNMCKMLIAAHCSQQPWKCRLNLFSVSSTEFKYQLFYWIISFIVHDPRSDRLDWQMQDLFVTDNKNLSCVHW